MIDLLDNEYKSSFINYIKQPKDYALNREEEPRLSLRHKDMLWFKENVLSYKFDELDNIPIDNKKESIKNLKQNSLAIYSWLKNKFNRNDELLKFGQFLINNCYLVVVASESQESASRIFSVLNSRGLDLLPTDILKAEIIDRIPENEQDCYTQKWENWEENLSRDGFAELFTHIRMIYAKTKADKALLEEFRLHVVEKIKDSKKLLDKVIIPYAEAMDIITTGRYKGDKENVNVEINNLLAWLNRIDVFDWKPVALIFYIKHSTDSKYLLWFFEKLERLAAILFITGASAQERIKRFAEIIKEIEENVDSPDQPLKMIELTDIEKKAALNVLNNDIYDELTWLRCKYIVLRLDSFVSDGAANYSPNVLTIEHVLPQTLNEDWKNDWDEANYTKWMNKIANLVLLSRRKNAQAQNYSFTEKKNRYFTQGDTSSFAITTQVLTEEKWTPEVVAKRQKRLISILKKKWEL